jgi:hypothetical protein
MPIEDKAIEEAAKTARHYLDQILLAPLSEFGLLLRDKVSFWRFKNQVTMVEKARIFLEARGVDASKIAGSVLPEAVLPLIEAGGNTSDPNLTELFAGLLASTVDPNTAKSTHPSFSRVLDQLSGTDAKILQGLYGAIRQKERAVSTGEQVEGTKDPSPSYRQLGYKLESVPGIFQISAEEARLCFENIKRLGICDEGSDALSRMNKSAFIAFTDFGYFLLKACVLEDANS